jgi:SET domain-containing protein
MLRIGPTKNKGLGIFANRAITKGELIEESPVLILSKPEIEVIKQTILAQYYFCWKDAGAIAFGRGSIFNHSPNSNVDFAPNYLNQTIDYIASQNIHKDEELNINYDSELLFEVKE